MWSVWVLRRCRRQSGAGYKIQRRRVMSCANVFLAPHASACFLPPTLELADNACSMVRTRIRLNDMAGLRILDIRPVLEALDQVEGELRDVNGKNKLTAVADMAGRLRVSTYA